MKFTPGDGNLEVGGHYESLVPVPVPVAAKVSAKVSASDHEVVVIEDEDVVIDDEVRVVISKKK